MENLKVNFMPFPLTQVLSLGLCSAHRHSQVFGTCWKVLTNIWAVLAWNQRKIQRSTRLQHTSSQSRCCARDSGVSLKPKKALPGYLRVLTPKTKEYHQPMLLQWNFTCHRAHLQDCKTRKRKSFPTSSTTCIFILGFSGHFRDLYKDKALLKLSSSNYATFPSCGITGTTITPKTNF